MSIRFFSGSEDYWICENGTWVKHGNPSVEMPIGNCGNIVEKKSESKIYVTQCGEYAKKEIKIGDKNISVDFSDTDCKRTLGLSGRESLIKDEGMLFAFEKQGNYGFWMKDMKFPIDIIWIKEDFSVSGIVGNFSPEDYPKVLGNNYLAKYVLEVPTGFSAENNIKVGNIISISE